MRRTFSFLLWGITIERGKKEILDNLKTLYYISESFRGRRGRDHIVHCSWIYNYLCNQCLSPLTLSFRIPFRRGVFDTTLCDQVDQWLAAGRWFSPVSSINKTDRHDITEILLKVALKTIILTLTQKDFILFLSLIIISVKDNVRQIQRKCNRETTIFSSVKQRRFKIWKTNMLAIN